MVNAQAKVHEGLKGGGGFRSRDGAQDDEVGEHGGSPFFGNITLLDIDLRVPWAVGRLSALWDVGEEVAEDVGMAVLGGSCYSEIQRRDGCFVDASSSI